MTRFSKLAARLMGVAVLIPMFALTAAVPHHAVAAEATVKPLEVGIIPNVSTRSLFTAYQPMRLYLEKRLARPVMLLTAPDFRTFYDRTRQGGYDLVITPPHLARLAEIESGYVPLATYQNGLDALLLVAKNSPIKAVAELRGKRIGVPDQLALAAMTGQRWLGQQGLKAGGVAGSASSGDGGDYVLHITPPHYTAVLSVILGDTDAAIVGSGPYRLMPAELRDGVRILANVGTVINATFMAHPRLSANERTRIKEALLAFANESPEGKKFVKDNEFGGMKPLSSHDLKTMDFYTKEAKLLLHSSK